MWLAIAYVVFSFQYTVYLMLRADWPRRSEPFTVKIVGFLLCLLSGPALWSAGTFIGEIGSDAHGRDKGRRHCSVSGCEGDETMSLSWTPEKRGHIFCSPACGRGCTAEEYKEAKRVAEELAASLGGGFAPEVWENLGWYSKAVDGPVAIHCHDLDGVVFTAFGGKHSVSASAPVSALRGLAKDVRAEATRAVKAANEVELVLARVLDE